MAIKTIWFDFGNVIYRFRNEPALEAIAGHSPKTADELDGIVYKSNLFYAFERGERTFKDFYKSCVELGSLHITEAEFIECLAKRFSPIDMMPEQVGALRENGYGLILVSDTNPADFYYFIARVGVTDLFDFVVTSFKEGERKRDSCKMWLKAYELSGCTPEECLYIDDIPDYIHEAGIAVPGINTALFTGYEDLLHSFWEHGVRF